MDQKEQPFSATVNVCHECAPLLWQQRKWAGRSFVLP